MQIRYALCVDWLLGLNRAQHRAHDIDRFEQGIGDLVGHRHGAAAQLIEQGLEAVRERGDFREPEGRAAALDGMRHAEDRIDELRIRRPDVEFQQRRFHGVQRFEALFEERIVELRQIDRHEPASLSASIVSMPSVRAAECIAGETDCHRSAAPARRRSRTNAASS